MPAPEMELPAHVDWRLREEFGQVRKSSPLHTNADVIYVTAQSPSAPQSSEFAFSFHRTEDQIDVDILYMTRFQKERWASIQGNDYLKVDKAFLKEDKFKHASVLHPLPRVGELDAELDDMPRAAYFRQAAYGVPVRMALIAALLDLRKDTALKRFESGFAKSKYAIHTQPRKVRLNCPNQNCITLDPHDGKYANNKFYVIRESRLRCFYCESDIDNVLKGYKDEECAYFESEETLEKAGFVANKQSHVAAE